MAVVNSVKIKLAYTDATSRTYTFNGVDDSAILNVKARVLTIKNAINDNNADGQAFKETFVSEGGAQCVGITDARIITTEQEVIYSAG